MSDQTGFDQTGEGREVIALLQKHAPQVPDSKAASRAVLARLQANQQTQPAGKLLVLRWAGPLIAAAAAVAVAFVLFSTPPAQTNSDTPPAIADKPAPAPDRGPLVIRTDRQWPEIVAVVRYISADGVLIDAGLKDGLRVGDTLEGPQGVQARVTSVGVFDARVSLSGGKPARGDELRARVSTEAQKRAASFAGFGGDPGAFFEFGALVSALPLSEARMLGVSDGAVLRVDESIPALLKGADTAPQPTLASQLDLRAGDVIVEVNGAHVRNEDELARALGWSLDPRLLNVRVIRNGKQLDLKLK